MNHKVNLQARIKRHSRILKDNLWANLHSSSCKNFGVRIVAIFIISFFPIYPALASFANNNSPIELYRSDIDETSILSSYYEEEPVLEKENVMFESRDSFVHVWTFLDNWSEINRKPSSKILTYTVNSWDTLDSIAKKFEISKDSILWANNLESWKEPKVWIELRFPSVSWIIHKVNKWETISYLAAKYEIDEARLIQENGLSREAWIRYWQEIILPWAEQIEEVIVEEKIEPAKVLATKDSTKVLAKKETTKKKVINKTNSKKTNNSKVVANSSKYNLVRRAPKHTFYRWNCTRFVAQYKNVNWWGNAKEWFANAKRKGHSTWYTATTWSIIVFHWRWYNPVYWHVWIVTEVSWNNLIIADMNYRRLWEVTYRKVSANDRSILWYIYVD